MIWVIMIIINRRKMGLIRNKQIISCLFLLLCIRLLQFDETSSSSSCFSKVEATSRLFTSNKFRSGGGGGGGDHSGSHDNQFNSTTTTTVHHHQSKNNGFHDNHHQGFININGSNIDEDGDNVFDVDKRRIHTGPNPLHNKR